MRIAKYLTAVVVVVGLFSVVLLVGYRLGSTTAAHSAEAQFYSEALGKVTRQKITTCQANPGRELSVPQCIEAAIKAGREDRRAELGLSAQKQMADWSWWLLWATIVQIPITALGVLLLLRTILQGDEGLREAREANKITRDMMELENRPILEFAGFKFGEFGRPHPSKREMALFSASWRNIGRTPALPVSTLIYKSYLGQNARENDIAALREKGPSQRSGQAFAIVPTGAAHESTPVMISTSELGVRERPEAFVRGTETDRFTPDKVVLLIARVEYRAAIGESKVWHTEQIMSVFPKYDENGALRIDDYNWGPPIILDMT